MVNLIAGIISAALYRLGGQVQTKIRDLGVPTIMLLYFVVTKHFHWSLLICFVLMFGSLTTYWKKKGTDAQWYNWMFTGIGYSLCMLPYVLFNHHWIGFAERTIFVVAATTLWSQFIGEVNAEEGGRGFIIGSSLFLLT